MRIKDWNCGSAIFDTNMHGVLTSISEICYVCVPYGGEGVQRVRDEAGQGGAAQEHGQ